RQGSLVAVQANEVRALALEKGTEVAAVIADAGMLHLDDVGPEVRQLRAAEGTGEEAADLEYPHITQRRRHREAHSATRRTVPSSPTFPVSWKPIGSALGPRRPGTAMDGAPRRVHAR